VVVSHTAEVTPDGWIIVGGLRQYCILIDHATPRPWGYWDQIRADAQELKIVVRMWVIGLGLTAAGAGLIVAAIATGLWPLLLGGLLLVWGLRPLVLWIRLARLTVRSVRSDPVGIGLVGELAPHPIVPTILAIGRATRPTGESVDVTAAVPLARAMEQAGTPTEVQFLDDPTSQYRSLFAARPKVPRASYPRNR
jgi:hypothetical protein